MRTLHCEHCRWPPTGPRLDTTFNSALASRTSIGHPPSAASMTCCHVFVDPGITKPNLKFHRQGPIMEQHALLQPKVLHLELGRGAHLARHRPTVQQTLGTRARISRSYMSPQPFDSSHRILPVAASLMFIQLMRKPCPTLLASGATPMPPLSDAAAILSSRSFAPLPVSTSHSLASMAPGGSRHGLAAFTVPLGLRSREAAPLRLGVFASRQLGQGCPGLSLRAGDAFALRRQHDPAGSPSKSFLSWPTKINQC